MNPLFAFALSHPDITVKINTTPAPPWSKEKFICIDLLNSKNYKAIRRVFHQTEYLLYDQNDVIEMFLDDMYEQIR